MSSSISEKCYDYFDCKEVDCARRNLPEKQCWEINDVQCHSHSEAFSDIKKYFKSKLESCKICMYYQEHN